MVDTVGLLLGTAVLRPYVFVFFIVYLLLAAADLGRRRAFIFTLFAWAVAFAAEFSSIHVGIPFGLYHYTGETRGRELYLAGVPFMDSLSFTFLAYASFCLARALLGRARGPAVVFLTGVFMMLLDVVIDPIAVRGDRWFLGRIFYYPEGGVYFGVPLSNFLGWMIVGWAIIGGYLAICGESAEGRPDPGVGLYYGVLIFNLAVTWWIGELGLLGMGILLHTAAYLSPRCLPRVRAALAGTWTTALSERGEARRP